MLEKITRNIAALLSEGQSDADDPEALLSRAQQQMQEMHAKNRERAVHLITAKNNLQQRVEDLRRRVDALQAEADLAGKQDQPERAEELQAQKRQAEAALETARKDLEKAAVDADEIRDAVRREEEHIRQKAAEAFALKAEWKAIQIRIALHRPLGSTDDGSDDGERPSLRQLQERHAENRRHFVHIVTQKNNLQVMVDDMQRRLDNLQSKADLARMRGDTEMADQLLKEKRLYEATMAAMKQPLAEAVEIVERTKEILRREEARIGQAILEAAPPEGEAGPAPSPEGSTDGDDPADETLLTTVSSTVAIGTALLIAWILLKGRR